MKNFMRASIIGAVAVVGLSLVACEKEQSITAVDSPNQSAANARRGYDDATFYALIDGTTLDKLSTRRNDRESSSVSITGLQGGEKILAIDFRPATGQLYGLGNTSRLYVINPITGVARMIGAGPFTPTLSGHIVGFDFNPTVDRIRVVTNTGQNLRLNPETGAVVATDGAINGQNGVGIAAVAYTNNFAGSTTTTLYDIDPATDKLFKQDPPNNGTLVEVGSLRLDLTGEGGFDIMTDEENGLALFEVDGKSTLFSVDLQSGRTKVLNRYDKKYTALAIPTRPVAYAVDGSNNLLIFEPANATDNDKNYLISISLNISLGKSNNKENEIISKPLTGLHPGEKVLGIDFRPLNGQLYALGYLHRQYGIGSGFGIGQSKRTTGRHSVWL